MENNAGTWFLSYLCEMGIISNHDIVECNYVGGKLLKDYFGIPAGYEVFITMIAGEILSISYASKEDVKNVMEKNDDDDWWEQPFAKNKKVLLSLTYQTI